jgi:hypothetical protein
VQELEFGTHSAIAMDHGRHGTMPPIAAAAVTRFLEMPARLASYGLAGAFSCVGVPRPPSAGRFQRAGGQR